MCDGLPYGAHGGHRQGRGIQEKEAADGRPQVFPVLLVVYTRPRGGVSDEDTDNGVLTAHKRGGCGAGRCARRERVLGPLWLPPPFFLHEESSFYFSSGSDGVTSPRRSAARNTREASIV